MTGLSNPPPHPAMIPGGLQDYKRRELADGSVITFEFAPRGYLTQAGEPRWKDWRAYFFQRPGGKRERMVSVTTLLGAIVPKSGLPIWAEARGIEGACEALRRGYVGVDDPPEDWVRAVRKNHLGADRARDDAADRGVNVHALLEEYMRTGTPPGLADHPAEHHGYLRGLCSWLLKRNPEPVSIEDLVCDPAVGYAGRRDLVAMCSGVRIGWDAKTQARGQAYASSHLQLRLYERAAIVCGDEPCDELRVVIFAADGGWREMPVEATDASAVAALAYYEQIRPIDAVCEAANRGARKVAA